MDMFYNIHQSEKVTTILVTHSMEDALKYADHVIILNKGKVYMEGKPEEVLIKTNSLRKVDRKSTRLNSSHVAISYAVFCLKKKKKSNKKSIVIADKQNKKK